MAWLVAEDGRVLASVEVADTFGGRLRGLLGRRGIEGALLLKPSRAVHSLFMRFPIDVAFCDRDLTVLRIVRLRPHRLARPVLRAHAIVEAEAGAFERWHLAVGDRLEVRE